MESYSHETLNYPIKNNADVSLSEFHLFSKVNFQGQVQSNTVESIYPTQGTLDHSAPNLEFKVRPSLDLTDLSDSWLELDVGLIKTSDDNKVPTAADKVTPCNNIMYNCFKSLNIELNGQPMHSNWNLYHLQSYIQVIIYYNLITKKVK